MGGWKIETVQGPTTYTITDGRRTKTVHVNRLRIQNQPTSDSIATPEEHTWEVPSIEHEVIDTEIPREQQYPTRNRRPPDRLTFKLEDELQQGGASVTRLLDYLIS